MATIDDRLMGYRRENYISSSEGESDDVREQRGACCGDSTSPDFRLSGPKTGPKGVIQDYRRYKQLETEQKREQEEELKTLASKFSLTCQSSLDDEREKELMKELEIEEDEFIQQYHLKRLLQMKEEQQQKIAMNRPRFGKVIDISDRDEFLHAIDKELLHVVVVIHLYDEKTPSCTCMNENLKCLAQKYPMVKFCRVKAEDTGISKHFRDSGLPALLIYKGTQMVGNFVQLGNMFGEDFYASDVEHFLIENGILTEELEIQSGSKIQTGSAPPGDDSDLELD